MNYHLITLLSAVMACTLISSVHCEAREKDKKADDAIENVTTEKNEPKKIRIGIP